MMVPIGRLNLVRTFAKSDLLRTMSFVSIPAPTAPMLGPIAGGMIVGYLHWRVIFFLNIPIGLIGLLLVYLHLPDYREQTHPLDTVGLILFSMVGWHTCKALRNVFLRRRSLPRSP